MPATELAVDHILDAVKQLPPDALMEFTERLAEWQQAPGDSGPPDSFLVRQTKQRLAPGDAKRLRDLARRSERGNLTELQLEEYRRLSRRAERISAVRVQALAELARRRNQPLARVKQDVDWRETDHGA